MPDIASSVNKLLLITLITEGTVNTVSMGIASKMIKQVRKPRWRVSFERKLEKEGLHLRIYKDGSWANDADLSIQLGYYILLFQADENANILYYC